MFTHKSSPEIRELARTKSVPNIIVSTNIAENFGGQHSSLKYLRKQETFFAIKIPEIISRNLETLSRCKRVQAVQRVNCTPNANYNSNIFLGVPFSLCTWYLLRAGIELTTHNLLQELYRLSHIGTERGGLKTVLTRSARGAGLPPNFGGNSLELLGLGGKMPKPHSQTASHRI